jgi:hypothetical protein
MKPYEEAFPAGSSVRIRDRDSLERFRREWKYHNPLVEEQIGFAGRVATVDEVGFYHGGEALYKLAGVPGVWHEECLIAA